MSVPHTSTHALSLSDYHRFNDSIGNKPVALLRHPVQRIIRRDGSGNPQNYEYDGFYELEQLLPLTRRLEHPIDLNDFDDVQWQDLDSFNQQSGVQPSNYSSITPQMLQRARDLQQNAKEREEEYLRYMRITNVRQAALERDTRARAVQNAARGGNQPPWQNSPAGYYAIPEANGSEYDGNTLVEELQSMGLGKRNQSGYMGESGGGKRQTAR